LGLNPAQYEQAKKELFNSVDGLSGVYKHQARPIYALVYKPSSKLSAAAVAAVAAGGAAVLGVGGGLTARHLMKKREVTPVVNNDTDSSILRDFNDNLKAILLLKKDDKLKAGEVPGVDQAQSVIVKLSQSGSTPNVYMYETKRNLELLDALIASNLSQTDLIRNIIYENGTFDFNEFWDSRFWREHGEYYALLFTKDVPRLEPVWSRPGPFQAYKEFQDLDVYDWDGKMRVLDAIIGWVRGPNSVMRGLYCDVLDQIITHTNPNMAPDIWSALLEASLECKEESSKSVSVKKLGAQYKNLITRALTTLKHDDNLISGYIANGITSLPRSIDHTQRIRQLERVFESYKTFKQKHAIVDEPPVGVQQQIETSKRLLGRLSALGGQAASSFLKSIEAFMDESKEQKVPENMADLLQYANTFINDPDDSDNLKKFRLRAHSGVLE
jgi:hypothetical protein